MKITISIFFIAIILSSCSQQADLNTTITKDLTSQWDTLTPLANPHKGWYHHLLDNGVQNYAIRDKNVLAQFPGMDHLYLRVAWSYLEPQEGVYDWSVLDNVINEYVPKGYGISFRITSKETGKYPGTVGQEAEGIQYATPIWVKDAGAKGTVAEIWETKSWVPDWDDPVYLEKLDKFHQAFAAKYDGQPYVRYIDVGSIGEWGEGHTSFSTKIPPTVAEVKANMDIHLKHYKKSPLVVTDDLLYYGKSKEETSELLNYALEKGYLLRDDSPLVDWYVEQNFDSYSVSHPHFFEEAYKNGPTILELQHYHMIKEDGNWLGSDGETEIPGKKISGADLFRGALKTMHATYIGYHGYMEDWFKDNPKLTEELLNRCGYWFFPKNVKHKPAYKISEPLKFSVSWQNKGAAPAYHSYELLIKCEGNGERFVVQAENTNSKSWLPDSTIEENYSTEIPENIKPGNYSVKIKLTTSNNSERMNVLLGLQNHLKDEDGFYELFDVKIGL